MGILKNYKVYLVGLFEIRVKERNVIKCMSRIVKGWNGVYNYVEVVNGRIWFIWKVLDFDVIVLSIYE